MAHTYPMAQSDYRLGDNRLHLNQMADELLRFGEKYPSPGGSSYYLGDDGTPWKNMNRETWITSRMVHVYSIGSMIRANKYKERAKWRSLAAAGLKGLKGELHDDKNGGWYAGLTSDGDYLPYKQCYAHAFVMLAASSAMLAGIEGAEELLEDALQVFDKYFWDEEAGLTRDTWNTEFTESIPYRGLNANMHTVEAFLAVADATGREEYRRRAGRIIDQVIKWAMQNDYRIPEHYTENWEPDLEYNEDKKDDPFKPYGATPGHGIEWARLITQWAMSTGAGKEYIDVAGRLYATARNDGWKKDGNPGLVYTTDWDGNPIVHDRMHWTLAEALNTSAVLYDVTRNEDYLDDYAEYMEYLEKTVRDRENGSWFHQMDRENRVMTTVWPGKSDLYHAFQSTLIPYMPSDLSIATAAKRQADKAPEVVALGELLIDFTENGTSAAGNPVLEANPGGAPCNVLAMLRKLGKRTAFIGKVGDDAFGNFLAETVENEGIDTRGLIKDKSTPTTLAFVHTAPDGDRSFSFYRKPGADMMLKEEDIDINLLNETCLFHFGTLSMTDSDVEKATLCAIRTARNEGKLISFDPNLRPMLWDSLDVAKQKMAYGMENCDILKIADDEILFFTGCKDIDSAIDCLVKMYPSITLICVTLGKEGSIGICNGVRVKGEPFVREDTIETTGAGDTFMGCVISYVLDNQEVFFKNSLINSAAGVTGEDILTDEEKDILKEHMEKMLTFANAAASLITTRKGALRVMPSKEEIENLLK